MENENIKISIESALRELHGAAEDLVKIVDGAHNVRWSFNGRRLVDTPEWCRFYVARCAANRASK